MFHFPRYTPFIRKVTDVIGWVSPFRNFRIKGWLSPPRNISQTFHVFHRFVKPRHPPYTLTFLQGMLCTAAQFWVSCAHLRAHLMLAQKLHEDARWTSISSRTLLNTNHLMVSVELKKICSCMTFAIQPSLTKPSKSKLSEMLVCDDCQSSHYLLEEFELKKTAFSRHKSQSANELPLRFL